MAEAAYRVSDTYPIRIHLGHAVDTYRQSILFFIIFANSEYVSRYVSVCWIRPSPNKTLCPGRPTPRCPQPRTSRGRAASSERAHGRLIRLSLLAGRRRRASAPACRPPAMSLRPRSLETSLRPCPRAQPPAYKCAASCAGMRHSSPAAVAEPPPPPCHQSTSLPPADCRAGEHAPVRHGGGQLP